MTCEVEPTKISDWVSIAVAGLAFGATWWQAKITREHNKISVTPMLVNGNHWDLSPTALTVSFAIKNAGVGVALVTDRYFTFEGNRFTPQQSDSTIEELCALTFKTFLPYHVASTGLFGKKARIPPGSELVLAKLVFPNPHSDLRDVVIGLTSKIDFHVQYECLYGEKFSFSTNE
jgi:hypothetical protein